MRVVAIIPARGGSKGIKNKNLSELGGLSLIGRAIRSARLAQSIQEVYVSTDSPLIVEEVRRWGGIPIVRPAALSTDESSSESAVKHALEQIGNVDVIVFIQCTSPFISSSDLDMASELVISGQYDSVFSAVEDHGFRWQDTGQGLEPIGHSVESRPRRQELPNRFLETGSFYAFRPKGFMESVSRFHGRIGHILVDKLFQIDIDDVEDLHRARLISKLFTNRTIETRIKAVVLDFDGVQTDDYVWIDQDGRETVRVSRSDGHGISLFKKAGIEVLILSAETNGVVEARARKLGVEVIFGQTSKAEALLEWVKNKEIQLEDVAYLGNETNDLDAMKLVGLPVAVADAAPSVINLSAIVLSSKGGEKAVRELAGILVDSGQEK